MEVDGLAVAVAVVEMPILITVNHPRCIYRGALTLPEGLGFLINFILKNVQSSQPTAVTSDPSPPISSLLPSHNPSASLIIPHTHDCHLPDPSVSL